MEAKDGNYKIIFSNLDRFYRECDEIESTGNKEGTENYDPHYCSWDEQNMQDDAGWVGLSREEILKSKYMYLKGLDQLKEIESDLNLGGTKRSYKWDEVDGDDLCYDRYIDNLPYLKKRVRVKGDGRGKIVNIHVSIGENCGVSYKEMLYRSYTVIRVIDYLESLGYRTGVTVYDDVADLGKYNGETVKNLHVEIQIKKPEEPLVKGLVLTCISPWMLRYHMFKLWTAKFKCRYGLGHSICPEYKETETDIYFPTGSCLNKATCEYKIKQLAEKFNFNEQLYSNGKSKTVLMQYNC